MSLADLLSGAVSFEIPEFQRDYRWTLQEARQLFEDLTAAADSARDGTAPPYFLGAIVLLDRQAEPGFSDLAPGPAIVDIVDGQQRLITLSILIACLRDFEVGEVHAALQGMLCQAGNPEAFQLNLRSDEQPQMAKRVLMEGTTRNRGLSTPANISIDNVLANRNLFVRELKTLQPGERRQLIDCIRHHCRLLVMRTADIDYAYQIFLTINDRGQHLTREDILRAEIIGPLSPQQRQRYEAVIDEFARYQTEQSQARTKKGKTFFSHLIIIHGSKGRSIIAEVRRLVRVTGGPAQFAAQVFAPLAAAYLAVKMPPAERPPHDPAVEHYLTALRWHEIFGDDDWVPLAMLWLGRFGADPMANIAFLRALDRFALALRALGAGHRERERRYSQIRTALKDATSPPDPTVLLVLSASEQRLTLNKVAKRCWKIDPQLCRLVLMRLDAHFSGRDLQTYEAALSSRAFTIEHILPRTENPPQAWLDAFPIARRRALLTQGLGNLILVPSKVNEDAGARPFDEKRAVYFKRSNPTFHLTNEIADPTLVAWTEVELQARQLRLLTAIQDTWGLDGDLSLVKL